MCIWDPRLHNGHRGALYSNVYSFSYLRMNSCVYITAHLYYTRSHIIFVPHVCVKLIAISLAKRIDDDPLTTFARLRKIPYTVLRVNNSLFATAKIKVNISVLLFFPRNRFLVCKYTYVKDIAYIFDSITSEKSSRCELSLIIAVLAIYF